MKWVDYQYGTEMKLSTHLSILITNSRFVNKYEIYVFGKLSMLQFEDIEEAKKKGVEIAEEHLFLATLNLKGYLKEVGGKC